MDGRHADRRLPPSGWRLTVLELLPARSASRPLRVLCLGAHSDDIEIGCAGTLLRLLEARPECRLRWVVFSGTEERAREATQSAECLAGDRLANVDVFGFRDGYFPDEWAELKNTFRDLGREASPDVIFTHRQNDRHQDHRTIAELTWQTFRNHLILEYEIPKYEGDLGQPNVYVRITPEIARRKAQHLTELFGSQKSKSWFDQDTFLALTRLRAVECPDSSAHAEAFHCDKLMLEL